MYEEERPAGPYQGYEAQNVTFATQISNWIEAKINNVWDVILAALIPIIQLLAFLALIVVLSVIINIYLRRIMVPRALIHERIYFDYIAERPTATIRLHSAMQQWTYIKNELVEDASTKRRFLKAGSAYDIHAVFTVAKSARNYDIGTTALTLKVVDASGETIAKSVRALVIPYQHPMSLLLESVTYFPWRATRTWNMAETVDIWVNMMPEYREPVYLMPPTDSLEISLAAPVMDLSHAYVTVMPQLYGIVYLMYYYPWLSFAVGCALVSGVQVLCYASIAVVVLGLRYAFQTMSSQQQDSLEMEYANSRRRKFARTAAAAAADSDTHGAGLDRSRAPLYSSIVTGDAARSTSAVSATSRDRGMREFVSTHLPGAVVEEIVEEDDNLIDAINADLLSSRDRHRTTDAPTAGRRENSSNQPASGQQHAQGGTSTVLRQRGLSVSNTAAAAAGAGTGRPDPGDWDLSQQSRRNTAVSNTSAPTTPRAGHTQHAATTPATSSGTPATELSAGRTRQHSVSFVPSPQPGSGVRSRGTSAAAADTAASASGTATPASRTSQDQSSDRESQEQSEEGEEFEEVFQNDFFNKFFPFLRPKGSAAKKNN